MRPSWDDTFMLLAKVWSMRSTCTARVAVGAVLVNPECQVIASGYNGAPRTMEHCDEVGCKIEYGENFSHCICAIHAEENAILQCAVNGVSPRGCTLYVTHSPCYRCALRFIQVGIARVRFGMVYGKDYKKVAKLLNDHGISLFGYTNLRGYFIVDGKEIINDE